MPNTTPTATPSSFPILLSDGADSVEHGECTRGGGRSRSTGEGCVVARVMVRMPSSMASAPGSGRVEEYQRWVCGGKGDGAHAIHKGI